MDILLFSVKSYTEFHLGTIVCIWPATQKLLYKLLLFFTWNRLDNPPNLLDLNFIQTHHVERERETMQQIFQKFYHIPFFIFVSPSHGPTSKNPAYLIKCHIPRHPENFNLRQLPCLPEHLTHFHGLFQKISWKTINSFYKHKSTSNQFITLHPRMKFSP